MKKRLISALLCIGIFAAMLPCAFAASDLDGHWAKEYIEYLDQEGVINPSQSTGKYEPNRDMTRAEFMRYVNRAFHFTETASISYSDVKSNAWYYETIQIAEKYGYINGVGDNKMDPDGKVTREQAAVIIGRLFKIDPGDIAPADLPFSDRNEVSDWSAGYIKAAADKGILGGYDDGTFQPDRVVTRGEVAKILYFYMGTALSTAGKAYTGADLKTDTANVTISESCTLSNATVKGDLYITEGLGSDAVTLSNVTVEGSIIVSGGTVTMVNTSSDYMIVSSAMGRLLQVTATGAARIGQTEVVSGAALTERGLSLPEQDGFADVVVGGSSRVSLTLDAFVTDLTLTGEAIVSTTAATQIYRMEVGQPASVTGYGAVYQANITASDVSFASSVTVSGYQVADGLSATIGGKSVSGTLAAGVLPESIAVDLAELDSLGTGAAVLVPDGLTVTSVTGDGSTLSTPSDYVKTPSGAYLTADYFTSLSKGSHTLYVTTSDGKRTSIAVKVTDSGSQTPVQTISYDRYYRSSDFVDVRVKLDGIQDEGDVAAVVLGLSSLDFEVDTDGMLVLRRSTLSGLRAGTYTVSADLVSGGAVTFNLEVSDSTPSGVRAMVALYNTYAPAEVSFTLPLSAYSVRSVTVTQQDGTITQMQPDTDFRTTATALTLTKTALEKFRQQGGLCEFSVTLSDETVYTLVIDYIA